MALLHLGERFETDLDHGLMLPGSRLHRASTHDKPTMSACLATSARSSSLIASASSVRPVTRRFHALASPGVRSGRTNASRKYYAVHSGHRLDVVVRR